MEKKEDILKKIFELMGLKKADQQFGNNRQHPRHRFEKFSILKRGILKESDYSDPKD